MRNTSLTPKDINLKAWRIYILVSSNRDDQAERALRDFGPDAIPVASALIAEDYLFANSLMRYLLIVGISLLFALMLCREIGISIGFGSVIIAIVVCAGLSMARYLAAAMVNTSIEGFHYEYRRRRNSHHPALRACKIACRCLTDPEVYSPDVIGALLMAAKSFSRHEPEERDAIDSALTRILMAATIELMLTLNRDQRDMLHYRLMTISDLAESISRRPAARPYSISAASDSVALLGVAILKAYEHIPLSSGLFSEVSCVRQVASCSREGLPQEWQRFIDAANHTLPIMLKSVRNSTGRNDLLRMSDVKSGSEEELLRPQSGLQEIPTREMFRPSDVTPSTLQ